MFKPKVVFPILSFFLFFTSVVLGAQAATVTNNGNITVRVQYKTPDGQYQDLGHVGPGETIEVPGGVEKVKIVREPGEWAAPLKPGEILDVIVKEGDQVIGTMDWYGDKVFFDGLTEGSPPMTSEPPKQEPKVEPPTQSQPTPPTETPTPVEKTAEPEAEMPQQNWPWFGGIGDFQFLIQLFMLWPFFLYLCFRSWRRPGYYSEGEWSETEGLGWGWGWQGGSGCGKLGLMLSLIYGLGLGGLALWGHANFISNDGLIPRFGQDLYSFPYFLLSVLGWSKSGISEVAFILAFWSLTGISFGLLCTVMPLKLLYATPAILVTLPFFLLMRGCAGSESFAYDGGYEGIQNYPTALSALLLIPMIFGLILDRFDPYDHDDEDERDHGHDEDGYDDDDEDGDHFHGHKRHALDDFFHGNPWPILVALTGGSLCSFYGMVYEYGMDDAIAYYFHNTPLSLGLHFIPAMIMIPAFWMVLFGMLAWAHYCSRKRFLLYSCFTLAFLSFLFLMTGNYPQRIGYYQPIAHLIERLEYTPTDEPGTPIPKPLPVIERVSVRSVRQDRFADQVGVKGLSGSRMGRELLFEDAGRENRNRDDR